MYALSTYRYRRIRKPIKRTISRWAGVFRTYVTNTVGQRIEWAQGERNVPAAIITDPNDPMIFFQ